MHMKKFAYDGQLTIKQLSEVLSYHQLRTKNNILLLNILKNPFFHYHKRQKKKIQDVNDEIHKSME